MVNAQVPRRELGALLHERSQREPQTVENSEVIRETRPGGRVLRVSRDQVGVFLAARWACPLCPAVRRWACPLRPTVTRRR